MLCRETHGQCHGKREVDDEKKEVRFWQTTFGAHSRGAAFFRGQIIFSTPPPRHVASTALQLQIHSPYRLAQPSVSQ
jgi:hypothetical protein